MLLTADRILPGDGVVLTDHCLEVDGGTLAAVRPLRADDDPVRVGDVATPGLVNAHTHLEYGPHFADLATSGLPFARWIVELTGRRAEVTDWYAQAAASARLCLASGTTTVGDVVTVGPGLDAAADLGLGGTAYLEVVGSDATVWEARGRAAFTERLDAAVAAGRRAVGISPHTVYTLGTGVWHEVVALGLARGLRLHPHLAETADEDRFVRTGDGSLAAAIGRVGLHMELVAVGGSGGSPAAFADSLGALAPTTHVAHGVHLSSSDAALLARRGTAVALCPRSNDVLQAGVAPAAVLRAAGVPLAVGTDSLSSSPSLDLMADVRLLTERWGDARFWFEAATSGGATALGLPVGRLAAGRRADVVGWSATGADPWQALVDDGRVSTVVLAGTVVA